ncbi:MAG: response regulator [Vogesella sp.]|uniref:response regulator n=1 Tax=Vogesella sp. TaxID=1904252 RepID=UPI00391C8AAC
MIILPAYTSGSLLHDSGRTQIYRSQRRQDGQPVILKALHLATASADEVGRLQAEYACLQRFAHPGIVQPLALLQQPQLWVMVLQDDGGEAVSQLLLRAGPGQPLPPVKVLDIILQLCDVLDCVHQSGLVHRDIQPSHLLWHEGQQRLQLTGFGLACPPRHEAQAGQLHEGTLAYCAPELTGRTSHGLDHRADYYSLGITLYQLLSGQLPFDSQDRMELVHAHLARLPDYQLPALAALPPQLLAVLQRLLEKHPARRYQNMPQLRQDLQLCQRWLTDNTWPLLTTGNADIQRGQLQLPAGLYGRQDASTQLQQALQRCYGKHSELVLICGPAGSGKTALAESLRPAAAQAGSFFLAGRGEAYRQHSPYAPLLQAFRQLLQQLLSLPRSQAQQWASLLQTQLGEDAPALQTVLPELAWLLATVPGADNANHGSAHPQGVPQLLASMAAVFADAHHPLIILLDDLQWADQASLLLLERLVLDGPSHLLVIGTCPDMAEAAPLTTLLQQLASQDANVTTLQLPPLDSQQVAQWLGDALRSPPERLAPLAELCRHKTGGNPFFLRQFVRKLYDSGLLYYQPEQSQWCWQQQALDHSPVTDNVLASMAERLQALPEASRECLQLAATLGKHFSLPQLATIKQQAPGRIRRLLQAAVQADLLALSRDDEDGTFYHFVHDRIQQAAYTLCDDTERQQQHLKVGRTLLQQQADDPEQLFAVLAHYNAAELVLDDPAERVLLARLNTEAGQQALRTTAFAAALHHLQTAYRLLPADSPPAMQRPTLLALCEAASLCGEWALSDSLYPQLDALAASPGEHIAGYLIQSRQYLQQGRFAEALALQHKGLALLGIRLPHDTASLQARLQQSPLLQQAAAPDLAALHKLGDMDTAACRDAMSLLFGVCHAAYLSGQQALDAVAILQMTELSLRHGHDDHSSFAYAMYAFLLYEHTAQHHIARQWGQFALELANARPHVGMRGVTQLLFAALLGHRQQPLRDMLPHYAAALRDSRQHGDMPNVAYILAIRDAELIMQGEYLPALLEQAEQDLHYLQAHHQLHMGDCIRVSSIQPLCCLMGLTYHCHSLDDESFSEQDYLARYQDKPLHLAYYYHSKLMLACLLQAPDTLALTAQLGLIASNLAGQFKVVEAGFYCGILLARAIRAQPQDGQQPQWRAALAARVDALATRRQLCESNIAPRHALLLAEQARCEGQALAAQQHYQQAIDLASQYGYVHLAALANECYGDYWLAAGQHAIAKLFLQQAWQGYQAWGAAGKCEQLLQYVQQRGLTLGTTLPPAAPGQSDSPPPAGNQDALDLASILKATRALSGELGLERVLARLLDIVRENTGAQFARLLLQYQDHWLLEQGAGKPEPVLLDARQHPLLPLSLVRYVIRSGETLLEDDLVHSQRFNHDPYVEQHQPSSVLCLPILRKEQVIGVLYLENRLISHAFSHERLAFLRMLVLQALVSIDNARLYDNLERQVQERTEHLNRVRLEQQAILDNALVGIAFVRDRIILRCNRGFEQMLGYDEGELTQQPTRRLYLDESDYQLVGHRTRQQPLATDMALQHKNGHSVWCAIHAKLVNPDDAGAGMVVVIMDISARKAAEQDMLASRQRAEEATRTKSLFLANMSHEIRTPMNAILGMARLALQRAPDLQVSHYLHKILSSGEGLLQILNDILDFSKIEAGKLALESVPFALDDVLERVADVLLLRTQDKPVEPVFHIAADVPQRLIGDPLRLEQILCNLASNAAKFTERGQIVLDVSTCQRDAINVTLRFDLHDSGIGIEPTLLEHLFHSFTQADGSVTRRYGGTGLGLAICKQLANLMQAQLLVESRPGEGSCFSLLLTLPWQEHAAKLPLLPAKRVLVADDHPQARAALCTMLQQWGMTVLTSHDGISTLGQLYQAEEQGQPIDWLLLDADMPGWTTSDTVQRIRDVPWRTRPGIVLLQQGQLHTDSELHASLQGTLCKPVLPAALLAQLQALAGQVSTAPPAPDSTRQLGQQLASLSSVAGGRILLVDDNAINREVVLGLLENSGLLIDVAENGIDAVDAVNSSHYDLVLMDIQMPLLDGFAATRQIRANPAHASLPIVALSAHAMVSDHHASEAAGMNDHLDKPIVPEALVATLLRWLPAHPVAKPGPLHLPSRPHNLLHRLQHHFVNSYRQLPVKLPLLREAGDWASIEYHTHSLKAAAAYVDAPQLANLASTIESALRDHQRLSAEALLPEMVDELEKTLLRLQCTTVQMVPPAAGPSSGAEQTRLILHLQERIKHADSRADEALQALFHALPRECHDQLSNIEKLLDQIEYDQAYRQLQTLINTLDLPIGSST